VFVGEDKHSTKRRQLHGCRVNVINLNANASLLLEEEIKICGILTGLESIRRSCSVSDDMSPEIDSKLLEMFMSNTQRNPSLACIKYDNKYIQSLDRST